MNDGTMNDGTIRGRRRWRFRRRLARGRAWRTQNATDDAEGHLARSPASPSRDPRVRPSRRRRPSRVSSSPRDARRWDAAATDEPLFGAGVPAWPGRRPSSPPTPPARRGASSTSTVARGRRRVLLARREGVGASRARTSSRDVGAFAVTEEFLALSRGARRARAKPLPPADVERGGWARCRSVRRGGPPKRAFARLLPQGAPVDVVARDRRACRAVA